MYALRYFRQTRRPAESLVRAGPPWAQFRIRSILPSTDEHEMISQWGALSTVAAENKTIENKNSVIYENFIK